MQKLKVFINSDCDFIPFYAHDTDAGLDVCSAEDITIEPGETKLIHTGIRLAIPDGYECQVRPRSGISLNTPLRVCNSPGTIDSGYRDEICVIMQNTSPQVLMKDYPEFHHSLSSKGNENGWYDIKKGDKIAQFVFSRYEKVEFETVENVKDIGEDRGGGFGSTGV